MERIAASNAFMSQLESRIVPAIVDYDTFWLRYFYRSALQPPVLRGVACQHPVVGLAVQSSGRLIVRLRLWPC